MTARIATTTLSKIARKKRKIAAPAIAPFELGVMDLKKRKSPPVKWRYGVIVIINSVELLEEPMSISIVVAITEVEKATSWVRDNKSEGRYPSRRKRVVVVGECYCHNDQNKSLGLAVHGPGWV